MFHNCCKSFFKIIKLMLSYFFENDFLSTTLNLLNVVHEKV